MQVNKDQRSSHLEHFRSSFSRFIWHTWLYSKQNSFKTKLKLIKFKLKFTSKDILREMIFIGKFEQVSSRWRS